jgi:hypothetical protein
VYDIRVKRIKDGSERRCEKVRRLVAKKEKWKVFKEDRKEGRDVRNKKVILGDHL